MPYVQYHFFLTFGHFTCLVYTYWYDNDDDGKDNDDNDALSYNDSEDGDNYGANGFSGGDGDAAEMTLVSLRMLEMKVEKEK